MQDKYNMSSVASTDFNVSDLVNEEKLQRIQEHFCKVTGIFVYCVGPSGKRLTSVSGETNQVHDLLDIIGTKEQIQIINRVQDGSLEEFAVETVQEGSIAIAAVSIRVKKRTVLTWIAFTRLNDYMTEKQFVLILDLLQESSAVLYENKASWMTAEAERLRSQFTAKEMGESLGRVEAMTEVVQLLDNDDAIEGIIGKLLKIVGNHLNVSCTRVYQVYPATQTMDLLNEWCNTGVVSCFDKVKNLPAFQVLDTEKPLVLSSDSIGKNEHAQELLDMEIKAVVIFPIMRSDNACMYICIDQLDTRRIWTVQEVKFISDSVKVLQSILTRRIQKNSLASSYASLEAVLDNVGCCIYVRDIDSGKVLFANRLVKNTFSAELQEQSFDALLDRGIPIHRKPGAYELNYVEKEHWYDLLYTEIAWVDGRQAALYSLYDITDKKVYQRKIEQQAYTDFLTGLYNRMCCERDLAWHIDDAKKRNVQGGILYLDLDDFKHINDGLGHQYGDVLLKSISGSLQRIEGIKHTCYRMGGDEFVIVIPPEDYPYFERIIEQIKQIFARPWFLKDADYYCTMSMGIVTFPDDGESVQDLIKKADIAMYEAKKTGKNRMARYSDSLESASGRRLDMEKNMRDATVAGYQEFEVYFQPIIDITQKGSPCSGAEALIRWNSSELGFISPTDFIPLAEYLGLINPIGNHVLVEACKTCKYWNDHGYPNYKVNVNLSVVQLLQPDIVEIVERAIKETKIRPHNLTLEVTESLAINDMERMKEILGHIKNLGVRLALDDFGTGYSSLNHIREIPFDVIKVDQSFVKDLAEDAYSQSFIKMIGELAETIGVSVCVEGIETEAQIKVLEGMKVRMIQGYYFDKPMTRKMFEEKYVKRA